MTETSVKQALRELVERLPEDCTWDDVMYQLYVRQKVEAGLQDVEAGRTTPHEEVFEQEVQDAPNRVD